MKKSFRTVFILLMLVCTAVLIWYVPASARLRQDTALRREELVFEQGLLKKQLEKDPIEALDKILFYQDKLDGMLSPELAELLQYDQVLRSRKDEKSRLQQAITLKREEMNQLTGNQPDVAETEDGSHE